MEPANLFSRSARSYNTGSGFPSGEHERWDEYVKKFVGLCRCNGMNAVFSIMLFCMVDFGYLKRLDCVDIELF